MDDDCSLDKACQNYYCKACILLLVRHPKKRFSTINLFDKGVRTASRNSYIKSERPISYQNILNVSRLNEYTVLWKTEL